MMQDQQTRLRRSQEGPDFHPTHLTHHRTRPQGPATFPLNAKAQPAQNAVPCPNPSRGRLVGDRALHAGICSLHADVFIRKVAMDSTGYLTHRSPAPEAYKRAWISLWQLIGGARNQPAFTMSRAGTEAESLREEIHGEQQEVTGSLSLRQGPGLRISGLGPFQLQFWAELRFALVLFLRAGKAEGVRLPQQELSCVDRGSVSCAENSREGLPPRRALPLINKHLAIPRASCI